MSGKRKPSYMEEIQQIKSLRTSDPLQATISNTPSSLPSSGETSTAKETAAVYFDNIYKNSTPTNVMEEYLYFLRKCPELTNNVKSDLIHTVKLELKISEVVNNLATSTNMNYMGDQFPILDALSFKLGMNLRNIMAPPTTVCLLCHKPLVSHNKPSQVLLLFLLLILLRMPLSPSCSSLVSCPSCPFSLFCPLCPYIPSCPSYWMRSGRGVGGLLGGVQ